jgi:hypothetical protein
MGATAGHTPGEWIDGISSADEAKEEECGRMNAVKKQPRRIRTTAKAGD